MNSFYPNLSDPQLTSARCSRGLPFSWVSAFLNVLSTSLEGIIIKIRRKILRANEFHRHSFFFPGISIRMWLHFFLIIFSDQKRISAPKKTSSSGDHCYLFSCHHCELTSQPPFRCGIGRISYKGTLTFDWTSSFQKHGRRQWHPTPVLLPGKSHGRRSLVGCMQSMGLRRLGHDWATSLSLFTFMHWRRKWQPTPVFLPGESQGPGSLVGCRLWGRTESDMTEVT